MTTFELLVAAHDTVAYSGDAVSLIASTRDGDIGIEANHEPLLALLREGAPLRFTLGDGTERSVAVQSGMLTFSANRCVAAVEIAKDPTPQSHPADE